MTWPLAPKTNRALTLPIAFLPEPLSLSQGISLFIYKLKIGLASTSYVQQWRL